MTRWPVGHEPPKQRGLSVAQNSCASSSPRTTLLPEELRTSVHEHFSGSRIRQARARKHEIGSRTFFRLRATGGLGSPDSSENIIPVSVRTTGTKAGPDSSRNILSVAGFGTTAEKGPGTFFRLPSMVATGQCRADGTRNVLRVGGSELSVKPARKTGANCDGSDSEDRKRLARRIGARGNPCSLRLKISPNG